MIGNAYHAQMPGFAGDLGHGDPGVSYSVLLAADAAGALLAGIALEAWGRLQPDPRTAIVLAILWSLSLLAFRFRRDLCAGDRVAVCRRLLRAVVQHDGAGAGADQCAADIRGRVVGLFNMAGLGMRAFSGITVGLVGAVIGIHWSLGLSAAVLLVFLSVLYRRAASSGKSPSQV